MFAWQAILRGIVTAPSDADETSWTYLAKTPDSYAAFGGFQTAALGLRSALTLITRSSMSIMIASPSRTWAIGPPAAASGATCPITVVTGTAESAVGDESDSISHSRADQRACHSQHLRHAGSALGSDISTPSLTASAIVRRWKLQGPASVHVLAIATIGLRRSSSVRPLALYIALAGARCMPLVIASLFMRLLFS